MKAYKPMNRSEFRSKCNAEEKRLRKGNFEAHWYLSIDVLRTMGMDKLFIQEFVNRLGNQYECLIAGNVSIEDYISEVWDEYGFKFHGGEMIVRKTENDEILEERVLNDV